jgi:hypothetical protein
MAGVGCNAVNGVLVAQTELLKAGYDEARVTYAPNAEGVTILAVTYRSAARDTEGLTAEYARAAEIVWRQAPLQFDRVRIHATNEPAPCVDDCRPEFTRTELAEVFGPRDPSLDKDVTGQLLAIGAAVLAGIALVLTVAVVLVVRYRADRRARAAWSSGDVAGWGPARGGPSSGPPPPSPAPDTPPPPGPETAPSPYADPYAYPPRLLPPPAAGPQPWEPPAAQPVADPPFDIWERPPS